MRDLLLRHALIAFFFMLPLIRHFRDTLFAAILRAAPLFSDIFGVDTPLTVTLIKMMLRARPRACDAERDAASVYAHIIAQMLLLYFAAFSLSAYAIAMPCFRFSRHCLRAQSAMMSARRADA